MWSRPVRQRESSEMLDDQDCNNDLLNVHRLALINYFSRFQGIVDYSEECKTGTGISDISSASVSVKET